jgi:hypothetical protein
VPPEPEPDNDYDYDYDYDPDTDTDNDYDNDNDYDCDCDCDSRPSNCHLTRRVRLCCVPTPLCPRHPVVAVRPCRLAAYVTEIES